MTRKDVLEMKQQVIASKDHEHLMSQEEKEQIEKTHGLIKDAYDALSEEDRAWVDDHMQAWYQNYLVLAGQSCGSQSAREQTSCSSCGMSESCGAH